MEDYVDDEAKEASKEFVSSIKLQSAFDESEDDIEDDRAKEALKDIFGDSKFKEVEGDYGPNGFNPKMEKVLFGARRILKKIEKSVLKTDKSQIQYTSDNERLRLFVYKTRSGFCSDELQQRAV